ncbi:MAG: hypothetical protein HFI34_01050 [Lachnospiraceae bacterium]|nr:hypothetical protein [Lachnospiraceae bacterium]
MNYNLPLYSQKYPVYNLSECNYENNRDIEYLSKLYPREISDLKAIIDDECDKLDYEGSMMYDEYPDKIMFMKLCNDVCAVANCSCSYAKKCTDKAWLRDIVSILMSDEMYKRRSCRRNYFRNY